MFPYHCPRCSFQSFLDGRPRCLHCGYIEPKWITMDENVHLREVQGVNANTRLVKPVADASTRATQDFRFSAQKEDSRSQTAIEHINPCRSDGVGRSAMGCNFYLLESEEPIDISAASESRIHLLPNYVGNINSVQLNYRRGNVSKDQKVMDHSATHNRPRNEIFGIGDEIRCSERRAMASNSATEINSKIRTLPISDCLKLKAEKIPSVDDSFAVPGPSSYHGNKDSSNSRGEKLHYRTSPELQSGGAAEKNAITCKTCKKKLTEHIFEHEGKRLYRCCLCEYSSDRKNNFELHMSIHSSSRSPCHICGELIFEAEAHGIERSCELCKKKFQCRTLLEQHSLVHEDYWHKHCRRCGKIFSEHFHLEANRFKCCECKYKSSWKGNLQRHLYTHTGLKLFKCYVCGSRFAQKLGLYKHSATHI